MAIGNEVISRTLCDACGAEVRSGSLFLLWLWRRGQKATTRQTTGANQKDSNPAETLGSNGASANTAGESIIDSNLRSAATHTRPETRTGKHQGHVAEG
jgi:hypothetical protein